MADYNRALDQFEACGLALVAVSVDAPQRSRRLKKQLRLTFPVLCDTDRTAVRAFGLLNEEDRRMISHPATVLVRRDSTIEFVAVGSRRFRLSPRQLLARVEGPTTDSDLDEIPPTLFGLRRAMTNIARFGVMEPVPAKDVDEDR